MCITRVIRTDAVLTLCTRIYTHIIGDHIYVYGVSEARCGNRYTSEVQSPEAACMECMRHTGNNTETHMHLYRVWHWRH